MGGETSSAQGQPVAGGADPSEELFLHAFVPKQEEKLISRVRYSVKPFHLMQILMTNPDVLSDQEKAIQFLIDYTENDEKKEGFLKPFFKRLNISKYLSKIRLIQKPVFKPDDFVPNENSVISNVLMVFFQYLFDIEIPKSNIEELLNALNDIKPSPNLVPPRQEYEYKDQSYTGIAPTVSITPRGLATNGKFLFVLAGDSAVHIFPILDNGALLTPFTRALKVEQSTPAQITVNNLGITVHGVKNYFFSMESLLIISEEKLNPTSISKQVYGPLVITDGIVIVTINYNLVCTVSDAETNEILRQCQLCKGSAAVNEQFPDLVTQSMINDSPCCTNGTYIMFYITVDDTHALCRQFSLITGEHAGDEIITVPSPIIGACIDMLHGQHWLAFNKLGRSVIVTGYQYDGVTDPYVYKLQIPKLLNKKEETSMNTLIVKTNEVLFGSMGRAADSITFLKDMDEFKTVVANVCNVVDSVKVTLQKREVYNQILQVFFFAIAINCLVFKPDKITLEQLRYILEKVITDVKGDFAVNLISLILSQTMDEFIDTKTIGLLLKVVNSCEKITCEKLLSDLYKSSCFMKIPVIQENPLGKAFATIGCESTISTRIFSLFLIQQRVIMRETIQELRDDEFASVQLFEEEKKPVTAADHLFKYAQVLINQFINELQIFKSFEEMDASIIYHLFTNFILLLLGMSDLHTISQIILPLLSLLPPPMTCFFKKLKSDPFQETKPMNAFINIGFSFGMFAATLIKGGDFSDFEERNKWLIRPNMHLMNENWDVVSKLTDPNSVEDEFILNMQQKMKDLYKFWKPAINRRLKGDIMYLDRIVLSILLKADSLESEFDSSLKAKKLSDQVRKAVDQMLKVRNDYIKIEREKGNTEVILRKCRMLLKMKMEFNSKESQDIPKTIASFITSEDKPEDIIHFIINQKPRIILTSIGFSLLQSIYTQKLHPMFLQTVATSLSTIDNFDGLAAIIRGSPDQKHDFVNDFLEMVMSQNDSRLVLIAHKMLHSRVVSNEEIGTFLSPIFTKLMENPEDTRLFGLCIHFTAYIPGATQKLFDMLPNSPDLLPLHLFLISDIIETTKTCTIAQYKKLTIFATTCKASLARNTIHALYAALNIVTLRKDQLRRDISLLIEYLGKSLLDMTNLTLACEYVSFFRRLLKDGNETGKILLDIFKTYKAQTAKDYQVVATFAILGGNIEVIRPYCTAFIRNSLSKDSPVITAGTKHKTVYFDLPFTQDTQEIELGQCCVTPAATIEFNPYMFSDIEYVLSFYERCTARLDTVLGTVYITSLATYAEIREFSTKIAGSPTMKDITERISKIINPFDTIQLTVNALIENNNKPTIDPFGDFGRMKREGYKSYVLASPLLKVGSISEVVVRCDSPFQGYVGIVEDGYTSNVQYQIVHIPTHVVYPSKTEIRMPKIGELMRFTVDEAKRRLTINDSTIRIPPCNGRIRVIVSPMQNVKIESIVFTDATKALDLETPFEPEVSGFNEEFKENPQLYEFPAWTKITLREAREKLKHISSFDRFQFLVQSSGNESYKPTLPPENLPIHPLEATELSKVLLDSVVAHHFAYLFSQWATVLITRLVANGYAYLFHSNHLMKLFSVLLIMLEPCSQADLIHGIFPFSVDSSVLTPHAPTNMLNFGLSNKSQAALHEITLLSDFIDILMKYVQNIAADPSTHLLSNRLTPLIFLPCGNFELSLEINGEEMNASNMIVAFAAFNEALGREVRVNNSPQPFPLVTLHSSIAIDLPDTSYLEHSIAALCVSKWYTSWAVGTTFELLLLLRTLAQLGLDKTNPVFIRSALIDLLLVQSPFAWIYTRKFLTHFSQNFIIHENVTNDYISRLLLLGSFINFCSDKGDLQVTSFFIQEQRALTSNLPFLLAPFFPEFISTKQSEPALPTVRIVIPDLTFKPEKSEINSLFLLYQNLIAERASFEGFPFYEILPLWLALNEDKDKFKSNIEPIKIETVSENLIHVSNPCGYECKLFIEQKTALPSDAIAFCSSLPTFSDCEIMHTSDLPKQIEFSDMNMYIKIESEAGATASMLSITQVIERETKNGTNVLVDPKLFHDEFVEDMKIFVLKWTPAQTRDLVLCFPSHLFEQSDFNLLREGAMNSPLLAIFSPRIVLLYTIFIHRFNYMWQRFKAIIPINFSHRTTDFISSEDATKDFISVIATSMAICPDICVDRHEAHRIVLEGSGDPKKTIIAQFTRQIIKISKSRLQIKEKPWKVSFVGEAASDAGGPRRELFNEVSASIFQQTSNLFILSPNGKYHCGSFRDVYVPYTTLGKDANDQYKAIGIFLGIVMRNGFPQTLPFAPFVWKYIAGEVIGEKDILMIDERMKTHFNRLRQSKLDSDFVQRFSLHWTVESWEGTMVPITTIHHEEYVTGDTVEVYIDECIQLRINEITPALQLIKAGFAENVGFENHPMMNSGLLSILAQGTNVITAAQLKQITSFSGFSSNKDPAILNFWIAIEKMSNEQRSLFLKFVTTLTRLPNRQVNPSFHINVVKMSDGNDARLPMAATCFTKLNLPPYSTPEIAFKKITYAIETCDTMEIM